MLILTRRIGESLQIGSDVRLTVLARRGNQVSIGIQAPRSVLIHRAELFERIEQLEARSAGLEETNVGSG